MEAAPLTPTQDAARSRFGRAARRVAQVLLTLGLWTVLLFLGARRWDWTRGWIAAALYWAGMVFIGVTTRLYNPGLIAERSRFRRKDTKPFDRLFLAIMLPLATAQPYIAGRDAGCAACTALPGVFAYAGALLFVLGSIVCSWVLAVNPHAETTVRIQTDRNHAVITSGPYRYVRHPMYDGVFCLYFGIALVWGSKWALAISTALAALFIWRTAMEDRTLRRELSGYEDYTARTPYRLLPRVW
jgi:protein-S-isoprenylcysteine O-methyltransferase Ste14